MVVTMSAWGSRVVMAGLNFVSIPLIVSLIGLDGYELYVLAGSLSAWYALIDIGLGSAIQNIISTCRVKKKDYFDYIVNAVFIILVALLLVTLILMGLSDTIGAILLQKYEGMTLSDKGWLFFEISVLLLLLGSSNLVNRIWYGEQRGYLANIVPAVGYVVGFIILEVIAHYKIDTDIYQVIFLWYFPVCSLQICMLLIRIHILKIRDLFCCVKKEILHKLWQNCKGFWCFAFLSVVTLQINYIIMSQFIYANGMVAYNLVDKIMNLSFFVYTAILSALWPVFTEAFSKREWSRVIAYCRRYIFIGVFIVLICMLFSIMFMPYLANVLLHGNHIDISNWFILMFGVYYVLRVWTDTFAIILQSRNDMRPFLLMVPLQAVLSVTLQCLLVKTYGIYGVLAGLMLSYVITVVWYLPYKVYRSYEKETKTFGN
ncbi:MATE family efflux transporter [Selenomonas ruminantium]|uniref:MATE family efflux transporter n=1 Tax=Selenomonas ruminantium TaxID=971 RepID=UPI00040992D1|nr:MATE family efflux transporter [Selenomonas ruminantium]